MEITCNWLAEPRAKMRRLFEKFYGACKQQKFYTRYLNDTIKSIIRYLHWPHIGEYFFLCIRNIKTRSLISDKGIVSVQCSRFLCSLYIQLIKKKLSSKTLNDELCAYKGCLLTSIWGHKPNEGILHCDNAEAYNKHGKMRGQSFAKLVCPL